MKFILSTIIKKSKNYAIFKNYFNISTVKTRLLFDLAIDFKSKALF